MIDRDVINLHPIMRRPVGRMITILKNQPFKGEDDAEYIFALFEGYRSPERQDEILKTTKNTKARSWQSAHQYGLAADFAAFRTGELPAAVTNRWSWPDKAPWGIVKHTAEECGLSRPIPWDKGHVEHPAFGVSVRRAFR